MRYAIVQTSGKQMFLTPGLWYDVDYIHGAGLGDYVYLSKILFFRKNDSLQLGEPFLPCCRISAKIIQQVKGKKITVLKTKPKKGAPTIVHTHSN